jgi:hypothetical protein
VDLDDDEPIASKFLEGMINCRCLRLCIFGLVETKDDVVGVFRESDVGGIGNETRVWKGRSLCKEKGEPPASLYMRHQQPDQGLMQAKGQMRGRVPRSLLLSGLCFMFYELAKPQSLIYGLPPLTEIVLIFASTQLTPCSKNT